MATTRLAEGSPAMYIEICMHLRVHATALAIMPTLFSPALHAQNLRLRVRLFRDSCSDQLVRNIYMCIEN